MSADLALQAFAVERLRADVPALDGRVFDRVAPAPAFPYASLGGWQVIQDDADCIAGFEIYFDVHVWSRLPGRVEAAGIASVVAGVLHRAEADLPDYGLVVMTHRDTRYLDDPDGLTTHAVVTFRALIEAP